MALEGLTLDRRKFIEVAGASVCLAFLGACTNDGGDIIHPTPKPRATSTPRPRATPTPTTQRTSPGFTISLMHL